MFSLFFALACSTPATIESAVPAVADTTTAPTTWRDRYASVREFTGPDADAYWEQLNAERTLGPQPHPADLNEAAKLVFPVLPCLGGASQEYLVNQGDQWWMVTDKPEASAEADAFVDQDARDVLDRAVARDFARCEEGWQALWDYTNKP